MESRPVLVVEAESLVRDYLTTLLRQWGYTPVATGSVEEGLAALGQTRFLFSLVGLDLNGGQGIELLRHLKTRGGSPGPIIMLFHPASIKRIAEATTLGADDFIQKPFKPEELENAIKEACSRRARVWQPSPADDPAGRLEQEVALWRSPRMWEVQKVVEQAAQVDITVLIAGETGTGKDLVARQIHHLSSRRDRPLVKVNCAAVPRELLESELFGHERGAFTGAHQLKIGKFESANLGAIFLDEIGDLHPALQAKLLHVLQDGEFSRVGGKSAIKVDVRIIAATNQDLESAVAAGRFREDLYYRLNVIQIVVPPLRERPEEIPALANYFAKRYSRVFNRQGFTIPPKVMERLIEHGYPGNVRELENIVKRMIVLNDPFLTMTVLPEAALHDDGHGSSGSVGQAPLSLKEIGRRAALAAEGEAIRKILVQTRWNRVEAAKLLQISYRALLYKIKDVGLQPRERAVSGSRT
ncbi:MAG: sigma-54-dependent transcriptional regulator [Candidatus Methylomirabilales bacterium]